MSLELAHYLSEKPHKASQIASFVAFGLACAKLYLFWHSGSLLVGLSAWDSVLDCLVSYLNYRVILFARQEADIDHPYGHGKAESLAMLVQGALILGGCIAIVGSSLHQIPLFLAGKLEPVVHSFGLALFFYGCAFVSLLLGLFLKFSSKKHDSLALAGDSEHYLSDVGTNFVSGLCISLLTVLKVPLLDGLLAGSFAIYMGWRGSQLILTSMQELMDKVIPSNIEQSVLSVIKDCSDKIVDVHNFRGRKSGHRYFFDFHLTLDSQISFVESHEITELVEEKIKSRFLADVVIHTDPDILPQAEKTVFTRREISKINI